MLQLVARAGGHPAVGVRVGEVRHLLEGFVVVRHGLLDVGAGIRGRRRPRPREVRVAEVVVGTRVAAAQLDALVQPLEGLLQGRRGVEAVVLLVLGPQPVDDAQVAPGPAVPGSSRTAVRACAAAASSAAKGSRPWSRRWLPR